LAKTLEQIDTEEKVQLKDPELAAFLAWLIPGLGHWYQGRTAKGWLFFICIMGTFLYGLYLGSSQQVGWGRVVYFSWRDGDKRLPYLCQVGVGLIALPALVQANRMYANKPVWWGGFMAPPRLDGGGRADDANCDQPTAHRLHRELPRLFELGTVYTMIGGLLNILAIYDAWGGPVFSEPAKKDEEEEQEEEEEGEDGDQDQAEYKDKQKNAPPDVSP